MNVLAKRNVTQRLIEMVTTDIDEFICAGQTGKPWDVTQSQDVQRWIDNPDTIDSKIRLHVERFRQRLVCDWNEVSVLDVGCYGGYLYDYLLAGLGKLLVRYVGIDVREDIVQAARDAHQGHDRAEFKVDDVLTIEGDREFDYVWCSRVLIHLPFWELCVTNLCRLAKKEVYVVMKIGKRCQCDKIMRTDNDTGERETYFLRTINRESLRRFSEETGIRYDIVMNEKSYSTITFKSEA